MKQCVLILLAALLLFSMVGCRPAPEDVSDSSAVEEESLPNQYVLDPVINRFVVAYKEKGSFTLAGLTQTANGNCIAYLDVCQLQMTSTTQGLHFVLTCEDDSAAAQERMLHIFASVVAVTDPSSTEGQRNATISYLREQTGHSGGYRVSNEVRITGYVPQIDNETVQVSSRLEFLAMNYLP